MATATLAAGSARTPSLFSRLFAWLDRFASTEAHGEFGRDLALYHARFRGF